MGMKINYKGLNGLYAKVKQVNIYNEKSKSTDDDGNIIELDTNPMAVVIGIYNDEAKTNLVDKVEKHVQYDINSADNPIIQAYNQVKPMFDVVEDNV